VEDQGSGWAILAYILLGVLAGQWQAVPLIMAMNFIAAYLLVLARRTDPRLGKICIFFITITWESSSEPPKPQAFEQRKRWFRR
jgi:asparagine N-glycosylation enzyme membrane subunit Stt3